jgi:uncharacterized protein YcbX
MRETIGSVTSLNFAPIKSCHVATVDGEKPLQLDVNPTGLGAHGIADREYVIVEADPDNDDVAHFVTQRGWDTNNKLAYRDDRRLALLRTDVVDGQLTVHDTNIAFGRLELPTEYTDKRPQMDVNIFGKLMPNAIDQGARAAEFFSDYLQRSVRLVRANREHPRLLKEKYHRPGAVNQTAGSDGFPILFTNQASLDFSHVQNAKRRGTVPIEQYRGNITTNGQAERPYDEDWILKMRIGGLIVYGVKACQRCPIPGINQETAKPGAGGQTILRGRLGYIDDPDDKQNVFGLNLNHVFVPGTVSRVGDDVEVLERSSDRNFTLLSEVAA